LIGFSEGVVLTSNRKKPVIENKSVPKSETSSSRPTLERPVEAFVDHMQFTEHDHVQCRGLQFSFDLQHQLGFAHEQIKAAFKIHHIQQAQPLPVPCTTT
jgi:hypothetical protein